jgi:hypothetical protein
MAGVGEALELPLRPSRWAACCLWWLHALVLGHALELLLMRHWLVAVCVALAGVRCFRPERTVRWSSLRVDGQGRLFLRDAKGWSEQVWCRPQSLRLGPCLLLVLCGASGVHRLVIGPDNLDAAQLAALRRRLPIRGAAVVAGVHLLPSEKNRL